MFSNYTPQCLGKDVRWNDDCLYPLLQTIYYEAGFLICATIGILFVVLVPIIALCFCVCRCCDNCGGEMHQRQRKNVDCQRGFYTALLVATSIFMSWVFIILFIIMRIFLKVLLGLMYVLTVCIMEVWDYRTLLQMCWTYCAAYWIYHKMYRERNACLVKPKVVDPKAKYNKNQVSFSFSWNPGGWHYL